MIGFARTVFGDDFDADSVVTESRLGLDRVDVRRRSPGCRARAYAAPPRAGRPAGRERHGGGAATGGSTRPDVCTARGTV